MGSGLLLDLAFISAQAALGTVAQQVLLASFQAPDVLAWSHSGSTPRLACLRIRSLVCCLDLVLPRPKLCLAWPHSGSRLGLACP